MRNSSVFIQFWSKFLINFLMLPYLGDIILKKTMLLDGNANSQYVNNLNSKDLLTH